MQESGVCEMVFNSFVHLIQVKRITFKSARNLLSEKLFNISLLIAKT